jgi:hypothetical protein
VPLFIILRIPQLVYTENEKKRFSFKQRYFTTKIKTHRIAVFPVVFMSVRLGHSH